MNALDLDEIVKDVPREVWPKGLSCNVPMREWRLRCATSGMCEVGIGVNDAQLMFEASMARWLQDRRGDDGRPVILNTWQRTICGQTTFFAELFKQDDSEEGEFLVASGSGPSRVEALAIACSEAP